MWRNSQRNDNEKISGITRGNIYYSKAKLKHIESMLGLLQFRKVKPTARNCIR